MMHNKRKIESNVVNESEVVSSPEDLFVLFDKATADLPKNEVAVSTADNLSNQHTLEKSDMFDLEQELGIGKSTAEIIVDKIVSFANALIEAKEEAKKYPKTKQNFAKDFNEYLELVGSIMELEKQIKSGNLPDDLKLILKQGLIRYYQLMQSKLHEVTARLRHEYPALDYDEVADDQLKNKDSELGFIVTQYRNLKDMLKDFLSREFAITESDPSLRLAYDAKTAEENRFGIPQSTNKSKRKAPSIENVSKEFNLGQQPPPKRPTVIEDSQNYTNGCLEEIILSTEDANQLRSKITQLKKISSKDDFEKLLKKDNVLNYLSGASINSGNHRAVSFVRNSDLFAILEKAMKLKVDSEILYKWLKKNSRFMQLLKTKWCDDLASPLSGYLWEFVFVKNLSEADKNLLKLFTDNFHTSHVMRTIRDDLQQQSTCPNWGREALGLIANYLKATTYEGVDLAINNEQPVNNNNLPLVDNRSKSLALWYMNNAMTAQSPIVTQMSFFTSKPSNQASSESGLDNRTGKTSFDIAQSAQGGCF